MKLYKIVVLFAFILHSLNSFSQIKGTISDPSGKPIPAVTISLVGTSKVTTSNDLGAFEIPCQEKGIQILVVKSIGFKSLRKEFQITTFPFFVNLVLEEEQYQLNEVLIKKNTNPATAIIKKAIANRKENGKKNDKYTADFYSKGIFRIKNAPKQILGRKLDAFDEVLDSTRSGILYLSETFSKIKFQKPDKMNETIIASKVSGKDNGFSFNNAASVNFDCYENYLPFNANVVSPIANNAFNYYKYKFEGSFFDENQLEISKIKVIPLREQEPVVSGYIYIVEGSWAIYAVDFTLKGNQMQTPAINQLVLKQQFGYQISNKTWIKNSQTIDFEAGILGININGKFSYVYSNYEFDPVFNKKTFKNEILSFEALANKKDSTFWKTLRPIPLTNEETDDYLKKDALQLKKKSKVYLDSIDKKKNHFRFMDVITGYTYSQSFKNQSWNYDGLIKAIQFNTVQGYNLKSGFSYRKRNEELRTYSFVKTQLDYGFSESKLRATLLFDHKFSNTTQSQLKLFGGITCEQFNENQPIGTFVNSVASLFFKDNYMKLYEKQFGMLQYSREVFNGFTGAINLEYAKRNTLQNHSNESYFFKDKVFTSNQPLFPLDDATPTFLSHQILILNLNTKITFGQKYWTRPDGKFNLRDSKYPILYAGVESGLAASAKKYTFMHYHSAITYDFSLGNKGTVAFQSKAGIFTNASNISFVDYKHFNGNQTRIGKTDQYLNGFNLLPYYSHSTNNRYIEWHSEYNDKGYVLNKLPLLNQLESTLAIGFHTLLLPNSKPYQEFSIGLDDLGFGKLKIFRLDYFRSYQNGYQTDGVIFGIKLLNALE